MSEPGNGEGFSPIRPNEVALAERVDKVYGNAAGCVEKILDGLDF